MYLGLRVLTAALWAAATALLLAGSMAHTARIELTLFMWCTFLSSLAVVTSAWVILDNLLTRESERNAQLTADAVAEALRQLNDEGHLRPVPTRRGG